jgi:hypothetical protein
MHITYQNFRGNQWEALVQSQVRFNRVPEKVPEKVAGSREGVGGFGFYCGYNHHRP